MRPFSPKRARSAGDPTPVPVRLNVVREPTPVQRETSSDRNPSPTVRSAAGPRAHSARSGARASAPLRSGRRGAGMLAGCPFVARFSRSTPWGPASSTRERLTRSRSPIDRKPSPLRPSGFHRSSSYCHHDKRTRSLQPPSRATFRADRVATLPAAPVVPPADRGAPARRRTIGRPIKRHPFSRPHD